MSQQFTRRTFLKKSLCGLAATSLTSTTFAQTSFRQRLDWDAFKLGRDYPSFIDAVGKMRFNTNPNDKRSWLYWVNAHVSFCPHNLAYFLAWHRGYLYYFEQQLRAVSGNRALNLPYWDYYKNPNLPAEFTNPASWNPLYEQRINTDVTAALTLAPFANDVTNMQRGLLGAFEPSLESMPHNPVHNIIGGVMSGMQSPTDPIFWLHHANIDRMFSAWVAAGNGRIMPARTDGYWDGSFSYAAKLTLPRRSTVDTRLDLGYFYQNESMPTTLPSTTTAFRSLAPGSNAAGAALPETSTENVIKKSPAPPPIGNFPVTKMRSTGSARMALGGAGKITLNENSVSARVPLDATGNQVLQAVVKKMDTSPFSPSAKVARNVPYTSIQIVLDDVQIAGNGNAGGYFYHVYLQPPATATGSTLTDKAMLGNLGPFQIAGARHHDSGSSGKGVRLVFPATQVLKNMTQQELSAVVISFVRVSGANSPQGDVITIGECRIEVSMDDVE